MSALDQKREKEKSGPVDLVDCLCKKAAQGPSACPPPRNVTHPLRYYEFTREEIKALEECDKESFYRRCLPLSTALGTATYAAIRTGYFRPSVRFGPYPKVTLAVIAGYFLGKLSYQQACAEKLMALPGSYLGQVLRDRRDGKMSPTRESSNTAGMLGARAGDVYSDAGPGSALDIDTSRPLFNDDAHRPQQGDDSLVNPLIDGSLPKSPTLSYDELRQRNRGVYSQQRQDPYNVEPSVAPRSSASVPAPAPATPPRHTNKYGDEMD